MVKDASSRFRLLKGIEAGAIALWLVALFWAVPNMAALEARIGRPATLLLILAPAALLTLILLVLTYRSWDRKFRTTPLRWLAFGFFWILALLFSAAFSVAGIQIWQTYAR